MRVLVTGGTGFLGRHLIQALREKGVFVRVLIREKSFAENFDTDSLELVRGDITKRDTLKGIARGVDTVFHLAAQIGVWGIPEAQYETVNVQGTKNLLDEAVSAGVTQFIFASTPGVQGKGHSRAREDLPYNPPHDYERSKCRAERSCLRTGRESGLPVTVIRPDFVYGPGDTRRVGLYRAIGKRRFFIVGRGDALLHPTYIDDAVRGFILAANNPAAYGEIYNIAGPAQIRVREYVAVICRILNVSLPGIRIPKAFAVASAHAWEAYSKISGREPFLSRSRIDFLTQDHGSDITKARRELGYEPKVEFFDGMSMTADWCRRLGLLG